MEKDRTPDCRYEEVLESVVVVVAGSYTHTVQRNHQSSRSGDVREVTGVIVSIKLHRGSLFTRLNAPRSSVDEQDIEPAVIVEIEKYASGSHRLGKVLTAGSAVYVHEVDAR